MSAAVPPDIDRYLASAEAIAGDVPDPELPMLTLADLGILRGVDNEDGRVIVTITPTYSGCPALREIGQDVLRQLHAAGFGEAEVRTVLTPPWTSDSITSAGRAKLRAAGIAPPAAAARRASGGPVPLTLTPVVARIRCPRCGSSDTSRQSQFGATACQALYRCGSCLEPFDYFKEI